MRPALVFAFCLLLSAAPAAQKQQNQQNKEDQPSCESAKEDLEKYLGTFSRACRTDSDCEGYYYRATPCDRAVVVRKHKLAGERERRLLALQQRAGEACTLKWRMRQACSPIPFRATCRRHACVDAMTLPPEGERIAPPPAAFPFATIRHACAPWDGPALQIILTKVENPGKSDARLFLTLYRDLPQGTLTQAAHLRARAHADAVGQRGALSAAGRLRIRRTRPRDVGEVRWHESRGKLRTVLQGRRHRTRHVQGFLERGPRSLRMNPQPAKCCQPRASSGFRWPWASTSHMPFAFTISPMRVTRTPAIFAGTGRERGAVNSSS